MNYVMSDLHGCYEEFLQMLELIGFTDQDHLIVIGDAVDRGPASVRLLRDLMARENGWLLMGNHEWFMRETLERLPVDITPGGLDKYIDGNVEITNDNIDEHLTEYCYRNWMGNGGASTFLEYLDLSAEERAEVRCFLDSLIYNCELTVENQKYLLVHTVPVGFDRAKPLADYPPFDLLFNRIRPQEWGGDFYDDKMMVVGHTPTFMIGQNFAGQIYKGKNIINIDCGCVYENYGGRLGCLRLEDGKEYYIG